MTLSRRHRRLWTARSPCYIKNARGNPRAFSFPPTPVKPREGDIAPRSVRNVAGDAFDVEVHAQQRAVIGGLALGEPRGTVLLVDRAGERVVLACRDGVDHRLRFGLHVVGD